jgi:hypothetical protein
MQTSLKKYRSILGSRIKGLVRLHAFPVATMAAMVAMVSSCQKVIQVDLKDAEKKYVIEAEITNQDSSCKVVLTQSKSFTDDNNFPGISGALVTISDNGQIPILLTETSAGIYQSALKGIPGHTYRLEVAINGNVYSASSTMPALVPFDSLKINERFIFGETNNYATVHYAEPLGKGNSYRFVQYVNGVKEKNLFISNDEYSDGRIIADDLIYFPDDDDDNNPDKGKILSGDTVMIQMQCLDKPIYTYWYSLSEGATGGGQSATPANPVSNIQGGALGYFSAHTSQIRKVVVP